jgi:hypothetical protein
VESKKVGATKDTPINAVPPAPPTDIPHKRPPATDTNPLIPAAQENTTNIAMPIKKTHADPEVASNET